MIFALSTCGAATLKLYGPVGLRGFLVAIQSFVRRKYPQIACVEAVDDACDPRAGKNGAESFEYAQWHASEPRIDRHMQIFPVFLRHSATKQQDSDDQCCLCARGDRVANSAPSQTAKQPPAGSNGSDKARKRTHESDEHLQFREWLLRFYTAKVPDKIPYVDVILNRYRGRYDDLKAQLCAKYGSIDDSEDASKESSSDSSNSDSSSDEKDSKCEEHEAMDFEALPLDRKWLESFYHHAQQPDKLAHVDRVLKQFSGREDTLKGMLLQKYQKPTDEEATSVKRRKLQNSPDVQNGSASAQDAESVQMKEELPKIYVQPQARNEDQDMSSSMSSPPSLCYIMKYQEWMASLGAIKQLVFDGSALRSAESGVYSWVFHASAKHTLAQKQHWHGSFDAGSMWTNLATFLTDQETSLSSKASQRQILMKLSSAEENNVHIAQSKLRYQVCSYRAFDGEPRFDYERTGWRQRDTNDEETEQKASSDPEEESRLGTDDQATDASRETPEAPQGDTMKLIILGTGSAAPSRLRGSTGIYLELKRQAVLALDSSYHGDTLTDSMLIDCGEGTYGQLWRQFGDDTAACIGGLRCIWISHSHADHQCGLARILHEYARFHTSRGLSQKQGLLIIGPDSVLSYASSWVEHIMSACGVKPSHRASFFGFVTCRDFNQHHHPFRAQLFSHIGAVVREIRSVPVWHCYDSYGLVLQLQNGQKIVYSGDTRPCSQLVTAGMDASLLIHEATFDDSMEEDAVKKKHSTVGEALSIARQMRAQEVILTHFSQRYPKLPPPIASPSPSSGDANEEGEPADRSTPLIARVHCAYDGFVHRIAI
ncbi:Zinc phosphodiesterase, partial [Globisporangium splendens]